MFLIVIGILEVIIGLFFNKGRDKVIESLRGGDVMNEIVCNWIVCEINVVNLKLNGLVRKDLNISINYFRIGFVYFFEVFKKI